MSAHTLSTSKVCIRSSSSVHRSTLRSTESSEPPFGRGRSCSDVYTRWRKKKEELWEVVWQCSTVTQLIVASSFCTRVQCLCGGRTAAMSPRKWVLTCESGGGSMPRSYRSILLAARGYVWHPLPTKDADWPWQQTTVTVRQHLFCLSVSTSSSKSQCQHLERKVNHTEFVFVFVFLFSSKLCMTCASMFLSAAAQTLSGSRRVTLSFHSTATSPQLLHWKRL